MDIFTVEEGRFGSQQTVRLTTGGGAQAEIALLGATLLSWTPGVDGVGDVVDGYRDEAEMISPTGGARCALMAPFSNRVAEGRYAFDGERYDLLPGTPPERRQIMHGFLRLMTMTVLEATATDDRATVRSGARIRPGTFEGYPFAVDLEVVHTIAPGSLTVQVLARNVGDRAAPYGCGWHPYFRLGNGGGEPIDHLELQVPARTRIRTDEAMIPLPGAAAFTGVGPSSGEDFRTSRPIGDAVLDDAFGDLEPDADGIIRTRVRNPASGLSLTVWQRDGLMHVFTGDTLDRGRRESVALEPVELPTNAFNRPDCSDRIRLEPGSEREFTFGVDVAEA